MIIIILLCFSQLYSRYYEGKKKKKNSYLVILIQLQIDVKYQKNLMEEVKKNIFFQE